MTIPSTKLSHGISRMPWLSCLFTCLFTALFFMTGPASPALVYDHAAIAGGEYYRLITGHLVHCDPGHLWLNLATFLLLGSVIERQSAHLIPAMLTGIGCVSAYLWFFMPELSFYCGLSGILNTLLVVALAGLYKTTRNPLLLIILFGAVVKIGWEVIGQQAIFTSTIWKSIPATHGAGFFGGILLLLLFKLKRHIKLSYNLLEQKI